MREHIPERRKLSRIARSLAERHRDELAARKRKYTDLNRDDFLWHYLLQSFATMGRSGGVNGLIKDPSNYAMVDYTALRRLPSRTRIAKVEGVLTAAGVRWPKRKAAFVSACLDRIEVMGGLVAAKKELLNLSGREEKIAFLDAFPGIGQKYARNIMMDVYHEDFRNSIALDSRIKKITKVLQLYFTSYAQEERFYLEAAKDAGLNGWELDRIMYNHSKEVLDLLAPRAASHTAGD